MLLFRLTTETYLSPQLLVYMSTDVPAQNPTRLCSYFHSDEPLRSTRPRLYCSACLHTYLFNMPVRFISYFSAEQRV